MFRKWILSLCILISLFANNAVFAAKHKSVKKQSVHASVKHGKKSGSKHVDKSSLSSKHKKKGKKAKSITSAEATAENNEEQGNEKTITAPLQMIAQNKEKSRISDSVHKAVFANVNKADEEGYFASMFTAQKKAASFQTLEGTAAVFKSISGWEDKKFYVLTNQLPVGTLVRITTSDLKSICAKVINVLPEMGNAVQYRLNDAAAAILGITNKTFQVSVTY